MKLFRNHYPISLFAGISIVIHLCVLMLIIHFMTRMNTTRKSSRFEFNLEKSVMQEAPESPPEQIVKEILQPQSVSNLTSSEDKEIRESVESLLFRGPERPKFMLAVADSSSESIADSVESDHPSASQFQHQLSKELAMQKNIKPFKDPVASQIDTRNLGGSFTKASEGGIFSLRDTRILLKGDPQFDFIPNKMEAKIIAILSNNGTQTTMEIYQYITDLSITHDRLEKHIEHLLNKGMLVQKKISPENKFGFFGIPIELSSTNRKNPVYEYTLRVKREKMIAWVESHQLWLADQFAKADPDSNSLRNKMNDIDSVLSILRTYKPDNHNQPLD